MIKSLTTREAFGGEVEFTNWLSSNPDNIRELLFDAIGEDITDIVIEHQVRTNEGKRVDLVVRDATSTRILATVECQDATGYLDPIHAAKSQYYAYDQDAVYNIILCEDSSEAMREYIRWENKHPDKQNYLVQYKIVNCGDEKTVLFTTVVRAEEIKRVYKKQDAPQGTTSAGRTRQSIENDVSVVFKSFDFPIAIKSVPKQGAGDVSGTLNADCSVTIGEDVYRNLSEAARVLRNTKSLNGWYYWTHNGKLLSDWRRELGFDPRPQR